MLRQLKYENISVIITSVCLVVLLETWGQLICSGFKDGSKIWKCTVGRIGLCINYKHEMYLSIVNVLSCYHQYRLADVASINKDM